MLLCEVDELDVWLPDDVAGGCIWELWFDKSYLLGVECCEDPVECDKCEETDEDKEVGNV